MNVRDIDPAAIEREEIRAIQGHYAKEHQALINWGRWSRDRRGIYPPGVVPPSMWEDAPINKWEFDEPEEYQPHIPVVGPVKGDRPEDEEYDEKQAAMLDERIHGVGGLSSSQRSALEVAYVTRTLQEDKFHRFCSPPTTPSGYRERLEDCLLFVARFV